MAPVRHQASFICQPRVFEWRAKKIAYSANTCAKWGLLETVGDVPEMRVMGGIMSVVFISCKGLQQR